MTRRNRLLVAGVRVLIGLLVLASMATVLFAYCPPVRILLLFISGRTSNCSLVESLDSANQTARQIEETDSIARSARSVRREASGFELLETKRGFFWILSGEEMVGFHRELAEQQTGIYGVGQLGVRRGDVVLDCGAHFGIFARAAIDAGARLVVAIEPSPNGIECIRRNLSEEIRVGRVIVYPKGVWNREDQLRLRIDSNNSAKTSFLTKEPAGTEIVVPVTTIDNLVRELKLDRVDFIKMDIEGSERQAVAGAELTIKKFRPRLALCVYHEPDDPVVIPRLVRSFRSDYRIKCACKDWVYRLKPEVVHFY